MDDRLDEVVYLQDNVSAIRRVENNRRRNGRNRLRQVLTGVSGGKRVFVPQNRLARSDSNLPFVLKRRQFPVRLAYLMTNNKSQGQTFDRVGVYLKKTCFFHGQLYVACSRTRAFNSYFFKIDKHTIQGMVGEKCYTNNVIFSNVPNL
ncbi:uncharacterized protein LOC136091156 [Hydra vulgaris]|uniref:Uncharacterized protein LOC136091156 n=1 Tax=Hydra vulgaris TaxID=6087 RepID=A0ABM4DI77_HYDVU